MAPHSSTLAWRIPWMGEPGMLGSMGSLRVRHDWATSLSRIGEGNSNPLQYSCLENPRDGGAWWAAVLGSHSHTWLSNFTFTFMHWRRKWQPTPVFLPGEFQGRGSLVGCRFGVAQSRTWLKQLSSSSKLKPWIWLLMKAQPCPTLCNPMDYTGYGILQARILE